jgi:hypothetical protein
MEEEVSVGSLLYADDNITNLSLETADQLSPVLSCMMGTQGQADLISSSTRLQPTAAYWHEDAR